MLFFYYFCIGFGKNKATMKTIQELNALTPATLMGHFSIHFTAIGADFIGAEMPVDERTLQPFGRMHGGAAIALAESVASAGSWAILDDERTAVVGSEVSASHVGAARAGSTVIAAGKLVHRGRLHHVWEVTIKTQDNKPVSLCRITNTIITTP